MLYRQSHEGIKMKLNLALHTVQPTESTYRIGHNFRGTQILRISRIWMQFAKNKFAKRASTWALPQIGYSNS